MRYFCYNDYRIGGDNVIITKSEVEVMKEYWPYWYSMMCKKYEQSYVDENYSFEDCLDDWCITFGAWRSI